MTKQSKAPIQVFLCYAKEDRNKVRELYHWLQKDNFTVWFDEEEILPGQDWELEIEKAINGTDAVIVFLSNQAIVKEGYVQKEIHHILDVALRKPEGKIFVIPLRLDDCSVPLRLQAWHWVDFFPEEVKGVAYKRILYSLDSAANYAKGTRKGLSHQYPEEGNLPSISKAEEKKLKKKETIPTNKRASSKSKVKKSKFKISFDRTLQISSLVVAIFTCVAAYLVIPGIPKWVNGLLHPSKSTATLEKTPPPTLIFCPTGVGPDGIVAGDYPPSSLSQEQRQWLFTLFNNQGIAPDGYGGQRCISVAPSPTSPITPFPTFPSTPTVLPSVVVDEEGVSMALMPSGEFTMGAINGSEDSKPEKKAYLDNFYIDIYEITNFQYNVCVSSGICQLPTDLRSSSRPFYYNDPEYKNYPVIYVSWYMAKTYCGWRGGRLPSEAEWERTARGKEGLIYPWGSDINCGLANIGYGLSLCKGDTTPVGSYDPANNIYDITGNVWEWTNSLYRPYPYNASDGREDPIIKEPRVYRGGSWATYDYQLQTTFRNSSYPDYVSPFLGFRCVRSLSENWP